MEALAFVLLLSPPFAEVFSLTYNISQFTVENFRWFMGPSQVNGYYSPRQNRIGTFRGFFLRSLLISGMLNHLSCVSWRCGISWNKISTSGWGCSVAVTRCWKLRRKWNVISTRGRKAGSLGQEQGEREKQFATLHFILVDKKAQLFYMHGDLVLLMTESRL